MSDLSYIKILLCQLLGNLVFPCTIMSNSSPSTDSAATAPSSVPLPSRPNGEAHAQGTKPPVWSIDSVADPVLSTPLTLKCDREGRPDGICCKDLKDDDDRQLIDPDIIRDVYDAFVPSSFVVTDRVFSVIGLSDGLTVPFALTAGLSSLGESRLVVVGGVAELIAGAISMGIGGFRAHFLTFIRLVKLIYSCFLFIVASQAERDHYRFLQRHTSARVLRSCAGEMEREVHAVLGPVGVDEKVSRQVADCLLKVEVDSDGVGDSAQSNTEEDGGLRWSKDVGLTAFLLKFGEGLGTFCHARYVCSAPQLRR
jgi:vacuolar iron transporter family protein